VIINLKLFANVITPFVTRIFPTAKAWLGIEYLAILPMRPL